MTESMESRTYLIVDRHHRGMASPADFCSIRLTYSLTIRLTVVWCSPLGDGNLWLSQTQVPPALKKNTNISVSRKVRTRTGCTRYYLLTSRRLLWLL